MKSGCAITKVFVLVFTEGQELWNIVMKNYGLSDKGVIGKMSEYEGLWKVLELFQLEKGPPIIIYILKYGIK